MTSVTLPFRTPMQSLRLMELALRVGDTARIAAALRALTPVVPTLDETGLMRLIRLSDRPGLAEIAAAAIRQAAMRDTVSPSLALEVLRRAHSGGDPALAEAVHTHLAPRVPALRRGDFDTEAAFIRFGPDRALHVALTGRSARRTPTAAARIGRLLIATGQDRLAVRYLRRCYTRWPAAREFHVQLVRAHINSGDPAAALVFIDSISTDPASALQT